MNLHQKLIELRKIVPYLQKNKQGFNYDYVTGTSLLGTIKAKMDELGLLLYPQIPNYEIFSERYDKLDKYGKTKQVTEITFKSIGSMVWLDSESGEKLEVPFPFFGTQDDISKAFGSALTYSERYFLLKFLNIATDKDDPDAFQQKHEDSNLPPAKPTDLEPNLAEKPKEPNLDEKLEKIGKELYLDNWVNESKNIKNISDEEKKKLIVSYTQKLDKTKNVNIDKVKEIVNSIKAIGDANYNNITLIRSHKPEPMQNEIDILLCEKLSTFMAEGDDWHKTILSIRDNNNDDKTKLKITSILVKRLEDVTPKG